MHTTTDAKDARAVKVEETHHTNEEAHLARHGDGGAVGGEPYDSDSDDDDGSEEIEFSVDFFAGSSAAVGATTPPSAFKSKQPSPVGPLQLEQVRQRQRESSPSLATARDGAQASDASDSGQHAHRGAGAGR